MECEICGKTVPEDNPIRAKIEGSVMVVVKSVQNLEEYKKHLHNLNLDSNPKERKLKVLNVVATPEEMNLPKN